MEVTDYEAAWRERREKERVEGLKRIIEAGGTENFLKNEYPKAIQILKGITTEQLAENLYAIGNIVYKIERCDACKDGDGCVRYVSRHNQTFDIFEGGEVGKKVTGFDNKKGKLIYTECRLWEKLYWQRQWDWMGVPPLYYQCGFNNYNAKTPEQKTALKTCAEYAEKFEPKKTQKGLLLAGGWGTGKTHLAVSIIKTIALKQDSGLYFAVTPKLLAKTRAYFEKRDTENYITRATEAKFLVLDDVGAEKVTEWVREQLFLLINERHDNCLPTIITTNCNLEELEDRIGGAAVSRIYGMCKGIIVNGEDYRKRRDRP